MRVHADVQVKRNRGKKAHRGMDVLATIAKQGLLSESLDQAGLYSTPLLDLWHAFKHQY